VVGRAASPSGASTGSLEALELRDGDASYGGKGVAGALAGIAAEIRPALIGADATRQEEIDQLLIDLDGTPNKARLGANAMLAVSLATARAAAAHLGIPLFRYIGGPGARVLPVPFFNVLNGGVHAANSVDIQEFMVVPAGLPTFSEAVRAGVEVYHQLASILAGRGLSTNVGDEGGFAPELENNRAALDALSEAVTASGYRLGEDVYLALDVAASELHREGRYRLDGRELNAEEMVDWLAGAAADYPLISIEDGMAEDDRTGWLALTRRLGDSVQLVGDDVFVTNQEIFRKGVEDGLANAILIKVNQIGTLSETLHTVELAAVSGYGRMISHRSGETEDVFISHLAVAVNAGQMKSGAPARGERTAKYNELLRIEEMLGKEARYAGRSVLRGGR
jgi:enolase